MARINAKYPSAKAVKSRSDCSLRNSSIKIYTRGYHKNFMLNSAEHEFFSADKC